LAKPKSFASNYVTVAALKPLNRSWFVWSLAPQSRDTLQRLRFEGAEGVPSTWLPTAQFGPFSTPRDSDELAKELSGKFCWLVSCI